MRKGRAYRVDVHGDGWTDKYYFDEENGNWQAELFIRAITAIFKVTAVLFKKGDNGRYYEVQ